MPGGALVGEDTESGTLPAGVPLIAVTENPIPRINDQLRRCGRALLDTSRRISCAGGWARWIRSAPWTNRG